MNSHMSGELIFGIETFNALLTAEQFNLFD
jgi:hypothetical protein